MLVITGAAGFIGSCLAKHYLIHGEASLALVDDFSPEEKQIEQKQLNFAGLKERFLTSDIRLVHRDDFFSWLEQNKPPVELIIHIGARTDTTEFNYELLQKLNTDYTKKVWNYCAQNQIPLIYASSAATYGLGEFGYRDEHDVVEKLKPLNPYGESKNEFDKWALRQKDQPPRWYGLKFFNVYGPNEYHKARMASVIFHAFRQIKQNSSMKLFKSHNPQYKDGEQMRDFVYVKDVIAVIDFLRSYQEVGQDGGQGTGSLTTNLHNGLYNLGSGKARTFLDLVRAVFAAMGVAESITFIDTPADIRDKYQYFTEADMSKLKKIGYSQNFTSLEEGVSDYVKEYLLPNKHY